MTPIAEMPLEEVTKTEADAYQAWRDGYQRNWNWAFDPIGLRISLGKQKLGADLTIMPLIMASEYSQFAEISQGAKFDPAAGDPHQALAQFILALNHKSALFRMGEGFAAIMGQTISLGWIGPSVSVYADDDPFWADLAKVKEEKLNAFMSKNLGRVPVAVRIDSTNPLKLAAFLAAARTFIEQTGPGLTNWESLKYKDQGYVRISPVKGKNTLPQDIENLAIYYTTAGGALTITLSERVLQQAIDRALAEKPGRRTPAKAAQPADAPHPWLGSNVALHVDSRILEIGNSWAASNTSSKCRSSAGTTCRSSTSGNGFIPIAIRWTCTPGLGRDAGLPRRRKVRLEREVRRRWNRPSTAIPASPKKARWPRPCSAASPAAISA